MPAQKVNWPEYGVSQCRQTTDDSFDPTLKRLSTSPFLPTSSHPRILTLQSPKPLTRESQPTPTLHTPFALFSHYCNTGSWRLEKLCCVRPSPSEWRLSYTGGKCHFQRTFQRRKSTSNHTVCVLQPNLPPTYAPPTVCCIEPGRFLRGSVTKSNGWLQKPLDC